jgi:hypothetical protein
METGDLDNRIQRAAESILENEKLTADLDDPAADALIQWGVSWATAAAQETVDLDEEQSADYLYPRLKATRRMLRYVNDWLQEEDGLAEEKAGQLAAVYRQAQVARGLVADESEIGLDEETAFLDRAADVTGDDQERVLAIRSHLENVAPIDEEE